MEDIKINVCDCVKSRLFPKYSYQYSPRQICYLCKCLDETRNISGNIAEVGCEYGHTTIFLNNYLNDDPSDKRMYFAIDTFSGFTKEDIEFEIEKRFKSGIAYDEFRENSKIWFDKTMQDNKIWRTKSIEADVNKFDLTALGQLSFVLLDVDLYRPVKKALPELYHMLSPGGIIVVDDCDSSNFYWDGAYQAYMEFMMSTRKTPRIVHKKLGLIKKTS